MIQSQSIGGLNSWTAHSAKTDRRHYDLYVAGRSAPTGFYMNSLEIEND
ncbi:MAG: hypothetical protein AB3N28_10680 [Kordiimonas sp.]